MTDKERLEDIKRKEAYLEGTNDLVMVIETDDYKWLIQQAERVQELEGENRILRTVAESNKYIGEQYLEQNKRYRKAIKECVERMNEGGAEMRSFVYEKLIEALEDKE